MAIETKTFTRIGDSPFLPDLRSNLVPIIGSPRFTIHIASPTSIEIRTEFAGVDLVDIQTTINNTIGIEEQRRTRDRENLEQDRKLKTLALVIADLHGLTPAQIRQLLETKYDSLP